MSSTEEDVEGLSEEIERLVGERDALLVRIDEQSEKLSQLETSLDAAQASTANKDQTISDLETRLSRDIPEDDSAETIRSLVLSVAVQTKEVRLARQELARLRLDLESLREQHVSALQLVETTKIDAGTEMQTTQAKLEAELQEAREELDIANSELHRVANELDIARGDIARLEQVVAESSISSANSKEVEDRLDYETRRVADLEKALDLAQEAASEASKALADSETRIATLLIEKNELAQSLRTAETRNIQLDQELGDIRRLHADQTQASDEELARNKAQIETIMQEKQANKLKLDDIQNSMAAAQAMVAKAEKQSKSATNMIIFKDNEIQSL